MYRLAHPEFHAQRKSAFTERGIVYVIRCLQKGAAANTGPFIPIGRVLKTDEGGVLYIGQADGEGRLARLIESTHPKYSGFGHEFGSRYKAGGRFATQFPFEDLVIELIPTPDSHASERGHLQRYEIEFGELPPFNRKC
jgi:hypothetical protein